MKHKTRPALIATAICAILGAVASWSVSRGIAPLWVIASALIAASAGLLVASSRSDFYPLAWLGAPLAVMLGWTLQPDHPAWFPLWTLLPIAAWIIPLIATALTKPWAVLIRTLPYVLIVIAWIAGGIPVWCLIALLILPASLRDDIEAASVGSLLFTLGYLITGIAR